MKRKFFDSIMIIDSLIAKDVAESIDDIKPYLTEDRYKEYFFNNLKSSDWIEPLRKIGMFSSPPDPIRKKGRTTFPLWPESRYLLSVVKFAPAEVLEIALNLSHTENTRVHEDFVEAACSMPLNLAARYALNESEWILRQTELYFNLPNYIGDLVEYLANGGEIKAALKLTSSLLQLNPDPDYEKKLIEDEIIKKKSPEFFLPYLPKPHSKFDEWIYERLLQKKISVLSKNARLEIYELLCKLLKNAIEFSLTRDEAKDYSYIWRSAIEDHEQNIAVGLRNSLIVALRDVSEQIAKEDFSQFEIIIENLLSNKLGGFSTFRRLALHLLRKFQKGNEDKITTCLMTKDLFDDYEVHREYWLLAKDHFSDLHLEDRERIYEWIIERENTEKKSFIKMYSEKNESPPDEDQIIKFHQSWLRENLSPIENYLEGELKDRYQQSIGALQEAEQLSIQRYEADTPRKHRSPKSLEEIQKMTADDLLIYLDEWPPVRKNKWESRDDVARTIPTIIGDKPADFATKNSVIQKLHPTFIRGFIEGFQSAVGQGLPFPWEPVLDLCKWIVDQPREFSREILIDITDDDLEEGNWGWTRSRVAHLIEQGLKNDKEAKIEFSLRKSVWGVIEVLTNDPEPSLESEQEKMQPFDPAAMSINTTRGVAMHTAMYYGLWVMKNTELLEGTEALNAGFALMPELLRIIEYRIDIEKEKTLTIRSVFGKWAPYLVAWDEEWMNRNKEKVFPSEELTQDHWDIAWGTYVVYNRPYTNAFRCLRSEYSKSLDRIGKIDVKLSGAGSPDESLAEHLMTFYWQGHIKLDTGGILDRFFKIAGPDLCRYSMRFIGEQLQETPTKISDEIKTRFIELWEYRNQKIRSANGESIVLTELEAFGKWFGSGKFDNKWALDNLLSVLRITNIVDTDEQMVSRLANLALLYPMETLECFKLMVEGEPSGYDMYLWFDPSKELLRNIIDGDNAEAREDAIDLIHRLGARGHLEYRDLLPSE